MRVDIKLYQFFWVTTKDYHSTIDRVEKCACMCMSVLIDMQSLHFYMSGVNCAYSVVLYCIVLCYMVWYGMVWYGMVLYCVVLCCVVL